MRRRSFGRKWLGRSLSALGTVIVLSTALALPASAQPEPGGNNGTVKVDGGDLQGNDNNPHVGCGFNIEWFGFDEGTQTSTVTFEGQAPTGGGTLLTDTFDFQGGGSGGQLDTSKPFDLSSALQGIAPQPNQGWHVKLTVETTGSHGNDSKHKTFWVSGCAGPTVSAQACSGQGGTEGITLSITNNDVDQTYTIDQDGTVSSQQIASGETATVQLPQPAADSTIHVTSGDNPDLTVTTVVPALACQDVRQAVVGSITLDKVLAGEGAPHDDPTFTFTVACDAASATVTSPVSIKASDAAHTIASDVPAGTSCTVTETDNGGADGTSFTVNGGAPTSGDHVTVTPTDSSAVAVVASNRFDSKIVVDQPVVGSITLDKVLAGEGAPHDDPTFTFAVACDAASATVTSPVSIKASDAAHTIASDVPAGTSCTVTETDNGGADGTSFTVNGGAPTSGDHVTVTPTDSSAVAVVASNRFDSKVVVDQPVVGSITLDKVLAGEGAPHDDPTFTFTVACDAADATVTSPVSIKASDAPHTVASDVPAGTSCTVTETNAHGASSTSFAVNGGTPTASDHIVVTPANETTAAVVVTNTFEPTVLGTDITRDSPGSPTNAQAVVGDQPLGDTALARTGFDARLFLVVGSSLILAGLVLLRSSFLSKAPTR